MNKIFLVKYRGNSHEEDYKVIIFATTKKSTAIKYVNKFNGILKKWKKYYSKFEEYKWGCIRLKDEHLRYFDRWNSLSEIDCCYWEEVVIRK